VEARRTDFQVLVVDDDRLVADIHRGYVAQIPHFHVAATAYSGQEVLRAVASMTIDLIMLDIYLPDLSGLDVLRALHARAAPPRLPHTIAVTAARDVETIRGALALGVVDYLVKPFEPKDLRVRLERFAGYRARLDGAQPAGQRDVDRILASLRPAASALPKGLATMTADLVSGILMASDSPMTAGEVADEAGLSRVSARRYLEYFAGAGQVEQRGRYGGVGRPELIYRWTGNPQP
jgi:response regulator of citrate/malate metabolism